MNERNEKGRFRLKEALTIRGINAAELSRRTGIPTSSISRYITGQSIPKQNPLALMAESLRVNPAWLMGYDVPMETEPDYWLEAERILVEIDKLTPTNIEKVKAYARKLKELQDMEEGQ